MKFRPTKINLSHIKVNSIGRGSSFVFGATEKRNINVTSKKTQGHGEDNADGSVIIGSANAVNDSDLFDGDAFKRDV